MRVDDDALRIRRSQIWPILGALASPNARAAGLAGDRAVDLVDALVRAHRAGGPLTLQRLDDGLLLDGRVLAEPGSPAWTLVSRAATAFERRGVGSVRIEAPPGRRAFASWMRCWGEPRDAGSLPALRAALAGAGVHEVALDGGARTPRGPSPPGPPPMGTSVMGALLAAAERQHGDGAPAADDRIRTIESALHEALDLVYNDPPLAVASATANDPQLYAIVHTANTALLSMALAHAVGLDPNAILDVGRGAFWADTGMAGWGSEVRAVGEPLRRGDVDRVLSHPLFSFAETLGPSLLEPSARARAVVAWEHHAGLDAEGYPCPAPGGLPHLYARIVAIADAYDALVHDRADRPALARPLAVEALWAEGGARFDRGVLLHFLALVGRYPPGSVVRLKDGSFALVVRPSHDSRLFDRPSVVVLRDRGGTPVDRYDWWDLGQQLGERATRIVGTMPDALFPERVAAFLDG